MLTTFTVITCEPNKTNGFVLKLSANTTVTAFGQVKTVKRTYYIGGMPTAVEVGTELKEDITRFDIKERETPYADADGNTIMIKWLHAKV